MVPFDPAQAKHRTVLRGIDPASLKSNKDFLEKWRIDRQQRLIDAGTPRDTMIEVNCEGVILGGNHGARVAAEAGIPIDVVVIDLPYPSTGPILDIPIVEGEL